MRGKFQELRQMLLIQDMWYGDTTKVYIANADYGDEENEDSDISADIVVNFTPIEKQMHLNIVIHWWPKDETEVFFATWYDNRPFERFTKEGHEITDEEYNQLIDILKRAGFKFDNEGLIPQKLSDVYCEAHTIKN